MYHRIESILVGFSAMHTKLLIVLVALYAAFFGGCAAPQTCTFHSPGIITCNASRDKVGKAIHAAIYRPMPKGESVCESAIGTQSSTGGKSTSIERSWLTFTTAEDITMSIERVHISGQPQLILISVRSVPDRSVEPCTLTNNYPREVNRLSNALREEFQKAGIRCY
jgi:hypothetical protein